VNELPLEDKAKRFLLSVDQARDWLNDEATGMGRSERRLPSSLSWMGEQRCVTLPCGCGNEATRRARTSLIASDSGELVNVVVLEWSRPSSRSPVSSAHTNTVFVDPVAMHS
jgi:hypothetical protein